MSRLGIALLLPAFASCGGGGTPKPDREQVREVVVGFFQDIGDHDWASACDKLTPEGREAVIAPLARHGPASKEDCVKDRLSAIGGRSILPYVAKHKALRVGEVKVRGERATVAVHHGARATEDVLVRTGDGWKIAEVEPPVYD